MLLVALLVQSFILQDFPHIKKQQKSPQHVDTELFQL